ncbi:hypothetical protein H5410_044139 [Solanum commersonii]|uniref:DUF4283 domain-containing protein n=1 Tax=Solanum commersonii TaxID=4109 RepID=A0A9J5X5X9_SOLCO|nr:hypothetical protein H5410_044139 [Solanum commersonii]
MHHPMEGCPVLNLRIRGNPMSRSHGNSDEEDSALTTVWVLLPKLPFHLHTWHFVKQIMSPVRVPMEMDVAAKARTRPIMEKVQVEIDSTKLRLSHVFVGQRNSTNHCKVFLCNQMDHRIISFILS